MNYDKNAMIGVLGGLRPERTSMDQMLQKEFNRCDSKEGYASSAVGVTVTPAELGFRTDYDMMMQREFNPLLQKPKNARENYCGKTMPGFASTTDNPYNPASYSARFLPPY